METIIDNEVHTLLYDEERQTVRHVIKTFNSLEEWQSLLSKGTDILKEKGSFKWLSDNRLNSIHPDGMQEWINDVWIPVTIGAGWKKWALVESQSNVGKISEEDFITIFKEMGVEVRIFSSVEDAENWI